MWEWEWEVARRRRARRPGRSVGLGLGRVADLGGGDVDLSRDESDRDASVRLYQLEEDLRADVFQQILDVIADECIAHYRARVLLEQLLKLTDLVSHICERVVGAV